MDSAHIRGWGFLDVYSPTVNKQGVGNKLWHLDGTHIVPKYYLNSKRWLRLPEILRI